jgi:hypothetical protein
LARPTRERHSLRFVSERRVWIMQGSRTITTAAGLAVLLAGSPAVAQNPTISPTANATELVNAILGPGVTLVPGTEVFVGGSLAPNLSAGTFTNGGLAPAGIGFQTGILLTTGKAADAVAPNDNGSVQETLGGGGASDDMTTDLELSGDDDLTALAGYPTYDATVLSFSFTTARPGDLTFRFVFASEEYIDWVGFIYNDVFAFYLDGENLAVLPGGGTPVPISVNTVNPLENAGYYRNNLDPATIEAEYDGLTTVLTAQRPDLPAGTHTLKIAIADGSDHILDAAVFIEGGSLQVGETAVPVDVKPGSCPNPLNVCDRGVLPVAILGTESLDVRTIDPATVRLQGSVAPIRWGYEDVATPFEPYLGKTGCRACNTLGPDCRRDLTLKFDSQEVIAALLTGQHDRGRHDRDCLDCVLLTLSGQLKPEYGGAQIIGEDRVTLKVKKHRGRRDPAHGGGGDCPDAHDDSGVELPPAEGNQ